MSRVMLDTSAYSMLRRGHTEIRDCLRIADTICVNPIALGELHAGFRRSQLRSENEALLRRFLASPRVQVAPVAEDTAKCYAQILHYLREVGRPIPANDLWIAAGAMEHGLSVVTTDAHFREVPQVRLDYYEPM
jgi:tRNA(fMet)-specific endonuclease VapC